MSSNVRSTLESLQLSNYMTVVFITAVGYDYVLTFLREIEYVWRRQWTWGSTLFFLVRYAGLCWIALSPLGTVAYVVPLAAFQVFIAAANLMMILRVYALWNRSKRILAILLIVYVVKTIVSITFTVIDDNLGRVSIKVTETHGISHCSMASNMQLNMIEAYSPAFLPLILGVMLFSFVFIPALKEAVEMYRSTTPWRHNRYIKLFVKDGMVYFFMNMSLDIMNFVRNKIGHKTSVIALAVALYATMCPIMMMPRFFISVRELYDRDARGSMYGIDSHGFGIGSQGHNATLSMMVYADAAPAHEEDASDVVCEVTRDGVRLA